ncbi:hypothetical protein, partial [Streptomyces scabiei]|uniref:hypothetical protein n=1 Tax=Streptomyces scabiei TaxID=1930 RepID=UPI001F277C5D
MSTRLREEPPDCGPFTTCVAEAAAGPLAGLLRIRRSAVGEAAPTASSVWCAGPAPSGDLLANPTLSSGLDTEEQISELWGAGG